MSIDAAAQLRPYGIAVNTFRIDVPVASEGFVANLPDVDHDDWEPTEVPAEGILWMLRQPPDYTGHNVGMVELRAAHGIMPSRAKRPFVRAGRDQPVGGPSARRRRAGRGFTGFPIQCSSAEGDIDADHAHCDRTRAVDSGRGRGGPGRIGSAKRAVMPPWRKEW